MSAVVGVVALVVSIVGVQPAAADTVWWTPVERLGALDELALAADGRVLAVEHGSSGGRITARLQSYDGQWGPTTTLLPGASYARMEVRVAVHEGDTYVLWTGSDRAYLSSPFVGGARLRGDTWTSLPTQLIPGEVGDVAMGADGSIVAVRATGQWGSVVRVTRFDGTSWSEPEVLDTGSFSYHGVDLEVAADGAVVVVGSVLESSRWELYASVDQGDGWDPPQRISDGGAGHVEVAAPATGEVVVAYSNSGDLTSTALHATTFVAGSWSAPHVVAAAPGLSRPVLEVEPDGAVSLAVADVRPGDASGFLRVLTARHAGGSWTSAREAFRVPYRSGTARTVDLAIGADGTAAASVAVPREMGGGNRTMVSVRPRGREWIEPFDPEVGERGPTVVVDEIGVVHAAARSDLGLGYRSILVMPFSDVAPYAYYASAVMWAADTGLTTGVGGTDEFQPDRDITRAEAITALWRQAGLPPAPASSFADVSRSAFYTAAVDWAASTGLTTGVGGRNVFEPNRTITRAELVTLLWRDAGSPAAPPAHFVDATPGAFYVGALDWAKHLGITTGVGGTNRFEPNRNITRAEAFTFLFRTELAGGPAPSAVPTTAVTDAMEPAP